MARDVQWSTAMARALLALAALVALGGCTSSSDEPGTSGDQIRFDTSSSAARAQLRANVAFARTYAPRCKASSESKPRVLLTGFGRWGSNRTNATGRIVSTVVPEATYPETSPPPEGQVDEPGPQLSVATRTMTLPGLDGEVEVCAMVLPVFWDLSATLVAREIDAFRPSLVLMNGIDGTRQKLVLELGAANQASSSTDGTEKMKPAAEQGSWSAPILASAPPSERKRANLLSWNAVRDAASAVVTAKADVHAGDRRFGEVMPGVAFGGFPRGTFVCNSITWTTGYLMDHPGERIRLLEGSAPDETSGVEVGLEGDHRGTPRVFMHWPAQLEGEHIAVAAEIAKTVIAAQLAALARGDLPTRGSNADADPDYRTYEREEEQRETSR